LAEIWCRALGLDRIDPRDDFFERGGDSLAAAQMLVEVQRRFDRELPLSALYQAPTLQRFSKLWDGYDDPASCPELVGLQTEGLAPPFFCVHGAGGSVLNLTNLARHLAPRQPFYGLRSEWSEADQRRPCRVEDMAARYVKAVRALQPEGPYFLGGFSFGGSVALEMAQQLYARGERVALLAILDHTPPPTRYRKLVWTPTLAFDFLGNGAWWAVEEFWRVGRGRRLAALRAKARATKARVFDLLTRSGAACGKTDVKTIFAGRPIPEPFRRLLEEHYQAMREYVPKVYPGRVTLFRAGSGPSAACTVATWVGESWPAGGWKSLRSPATTKPSSSRHTSSPWPRRCWFTSRRHRRSDEGFDSPSPAFWETSDETLES
jgi:thioesterase domain-containing protein/acyl carrier protein